MTILIIHLSDMHLSRAAVLPRSREIAVAALSQLANLRAVYVAISGDIVNRGTSDEFELAHSFLADLSQCIKEQVGLDVRYVMCSGNHDCDFSANQDVRGIILNQVRENRTEISPAITEVLTGPLENYRNFQSKMSPKTVQISPWVSRLDAPEDGVVFVPIHSSVTSSVRELPGTLVVPSFKTNGLHKGCRVIYMMHHPYNWLNPDNARELAQHVAATGDIFLMGHEHVQWAQSVTELYEAASITYLKAQVLRDTANPDNSGFQTIELCNERGFLPRTYNWEGGRYVLSKTPVGGDYISWPSAPMHHGLALSDTGYETLSAAGANFTHRKKHTLTLPDIFVWPELRSADREGKTDGVGDSYKFDAEELVRGISGLSGMVVIKGAESFGKSALARMIALRLSSQGYYPLLLEASRISSWREKSLNERVDRAIDHFFGPHNRDSFRQANKQNKCLILDDFDLTSVSAGYVDGLLALRQHFGRVFVFVDSNPGLEMALSEFLRNENFADTEVFELLPTSFGRRLELIERWLLIGESRDQTRENMRLTAAKWSKFVDETLGRNLIPSIPLFILVILQRAETEGDLETIAKSGSHGFLYECLITQALTRHVTEWSVRTALTYLSSFAGLLFRNSVDALPQNLFDKFHVEHCEEHDLDASVAKIQRQMSDAGIIDAAEGVRFKYLFHHYYFVARYLCTIEWSEIEVTIDDMVDSLHTERSANILLFLAHLGNNPRIAEKVFERAGSCLPQYTDADIFAQNSVMERFALQEIRETLHEGTRRQQLEAHSALNSSVEVARQDFSRAAEERIKSRLSDVLAMNTVFKALQVLGQLLRNHAGDMKKHERRQLAEQCVSLGLRALNFILSTTVEHRDSFVEFRALQIRSQRPEATEPEIAEDVSRFLPNLIANMTVGILIRIANAIGSEELAVTLDSVLSKSKTHRLIGLVTRLEHFAEIPSQGVLDYKRDHVRDNDVLPFAVLRRFLIRRFYLYPCREELRRPLCAELKIKIESFAALPQKKLDLKR